MYGHDGVTRGTRRLGRPFTASCLCLSLTHSLSCLACFPRAPDVGRSIRCARTFYAGCIEHSPKELAWLDSWEAVQVGRHGWSIRRVRGLQCSPGINFHLYIVLFCFSCF